MMKQNKGTEDLRNFYEEKEKNISRKKKKKTVAFSFSLKI